MGVFDQDTNIKREVNLDDDSRTDMLLDYAFGYYADQLLWNGESDVQEHFRKSFINMFHALECACPMWWFPPYLEPYLILHLNDISFQTEQDGLHIILKYRCGENREIHNKEKEFIF